MKKIELNNTDFEHLANFANKDSFIRDEFYNKEFAQRLVECNGWLLKLFSDEVRNDKKVVLSAVKDVGASIIYASKYLQKDSEVIEAASKSKSYVVIEGTKVYVVKLSGLKYGNSYGQVYTFSSNPNQFKKGDLEVGRLSRYRHSLVVEQTTLVDMNDLPLRITSVKIPGINHYSKFKTDNIISEHILQDRPLSEVFNALKIDFKPYRLSFNHKGQIGLVNVTLGQGGSKKYIFGYNGVDLKKGDRLLVGYPEEQSEAKAVSDVYFIHPSELEIPLMILCFVIKKA